jgi:lipoprotein-releasing system permease protein
MNFEYFLAKRIHFRQEDKKRVSRPAVRIATIGIAVGLAVMIVAVSVVIGFKNEVQNKAIGFGGHVQISNFDNNNTYEMQPIQMDDDLIESILKVEGVKHVQRFATKPCIIKTDSDFQGVILKGVGEDFDWDFFRSNLLEGELLDYSHDSVNQVIISETLCNLLNLKLGDSFLTYFIQDQVRMRKFSIRGIYSTNFGEHDKLFLLTDVRCIQRLNKWDEASFGGLEILINNFDHIDAVGDRIYDLTANRFNDEGAAYYTRTIKEINPQIFQWLDLLDTNVWVILILVLAVAGFNMISGLLILILERTNMIGILKAMGSADWSIRKIFLYHSFFLIAKGLLWGNAIGLIICSIQYYTHIIPLEPKDYYTSFVPVEINLPYILLLNVGTLAASLLMMIAPSFLITKISPAKTIKYE